MNEGRRIAGRYHLLEAIGRGGMGIVWRAHNEVLDRTVAVKEVLHRTASEEEREAFNQRTVREARAAGRIAHPGVVVVHDVIEEDDRPWIVMQFVRARSLGAVLREEGPLPPRRIADIGRQVLDALRTAHAAGMAFNQQAARVSFHDSSRSGSAGRLHEVDGCRSRAGADRRRDRLEKAGASPRLPAHPARGRPPARNAGRRVEFTYTPSYGRVRVLDRAFRLPDGRRSLLADH